MQGWDPYVEAEWKARNAASAEYDRGVERGAEFERQKAEKEQESLREKQRAVILQKAEVILASCNSHHITYSLGVLRGLVWSYTGVDPGDLKDAGDLGPLLGVELELCDGKLSETRAKPTEVRLNPEKSTGIYQTEQKNPRRPLVRCVHVTYACSTCGEFCVVHQSREPKQRCGSCGAGCWVVSVDFYAERGPQENWRWSPETDQRVLTDVWNGFPTQEEIDRTYES